jgi:uncharacterized protein (DUF2461 family)
VPSQNTGCRIDPPSNGLPGLKENRRIRAITAVAGLDKRTRCLKENEALLGTIRGFERLTSRDLIDN